MCVSVCAVRCYVLVCRECARTRLSVCGSQRGTSVPSGPQSRMLTTGIHSFMHTAGIHSREHGGFIAGTSAVRSSSGGSGDCARISHAHASIGWVCAGEAASACIHSAQTDCMRFQRCCRRKHWARTRLRRVPSCQRTDGTKRQRPSHRSSHPPTPGWLRRRPTSTVYPHDRLPRPDLHGAHVPVQRHGVKLWRSPLNSWPRST